ncbi:NAD(P)-dependent alcohol dehydrogenase [Candidatus Acetothermia bacterium]|nr:NAD(P)-dependent alcohol dehydrogenase [Candidatus Acetothermia bacterium]
MKGFAMLKIGVAGWVERGKPKPGPIDAVVRPLAVGMCTSDIHTVYDGPLGDVNFIMGHEAVGEVVEVGREVKDFQPGDRIVVGAITPDWRTIDVQRGWHQHSGGMLAGFKFTTVKDGVFAEYFHVNDADMNLAHLPNEIPLEAAVMLSDMIPTGFHGVELADMGFGMTVCVIGIGPIGLMSVAAARLRGAGRIIAVGTRQACVEAAKYYGATDIISYKTGDIAKQVMNLTGGIGVDVAIVAGGEKDGEGLSQAIKMTKAGGTISNVAYFSTGETLPIPRNEWGLGMGHKTIKGGLMPAGRYKLERFIDLVRYNRVDPSKLATHVFHGMKNIEKAWYLMKEKPANLIKPVVIY